MYIPGSHSKFETNLIDPPTSSPVKFEEYNPNIINIKSLSTNYTSTLPANGSSIWKKKAKEIEEYQVCTLPTEKACNDKFEKTPYRHIKLITAIKDAEFATADNVEPKIIQDRYMYCAAQIIPKMCNLYKCNNVYDSNSSDEIKDMCDTCLLYTSPSPRD